MRWKLFLLLIASTGCASDPSEPLPCDVVRDSSGRAIVSTEAVRASAELGLERTQEALRQFPQGSWATGFPGPFARRLAGSSAHDFAVNIQALRAHLARTKALENAIVNEGSTLIGTTEEWECDMLANSVSSLDMSQSGESFRDSLGRVETYFHSLLRIFGETPEDDQRSPR